MGDRPQIVLTEDHGRSIRVDMKPNGVIDQDTFEDLWGRLLVRIQNSVVYAEVADAEVPRELWDKSTTIERVILPRGARRIDDSAFYDWISLEEVSIACGVTKIGMSAFEGCVSLASVVIPYGVTDIYDRAFYGCTSLVSVVLPRTLTELDWPKVFAHCTSLVSITFPAPTKVPDTFFDGVTRINNFIFEGCSSLESVTLPSSLQRIGLGVFKDCVSLKEITFPQKCTSIGRTALDGCRNLRKVTISAFLDPDYGLGAPLFTIDQLLSDRDDAFPMLEEVVETSGRGPIYDRIHRIGRGTRTRSAEAEDSPPKRARVVPGSGSLYRDWTEAGPHIP